MSKQCPNCITELDETYTRTQDFSHYYWFFKCNECDYCQPIHLAQTREQFEAEQKKVIEDGHSRPLTLTLSVGKWCKLHTLAYLGSIKEADNETLEFLDLFADKIHEARAELLD